MERYTLPDRTAWNLGRCFCCERWTLVAPGPTYGPPDDPMTLPLCVVGFERAERKRHRARLRTGMHARTEGAIA